MNQHTLRYGIGLFLLLVLLGHAARFYQIPVLGNLDQIAYDTKLSLTMPGGVDNRVVILDIDERSLAEIGRWPWSRERLAALMDTLFERYGVVLLGVDVVFAEPDTSSGLPTLERLAQGPLADNAGFRESLDRLRPELDYDARFAASLKDRPILLGYYFGDRTDSLNSGALPAPVLPSRHLSRTKHCFRFVQQLRCKSAALPGCRARRRTFQPAARLRWSESSRSDAGRVQGRLLRIAVARHRAYPAGESRTGTGLRGQAAFQHPAGTTPGLSGWN
jgi:hypothetical protein